MAKRQYMTGDCLRDGASADKSELHNAPLSDTAKLARRSIGRREIRLLTHRFRRNQPGNFILERKFHLY